MPPVKTALLVIDMQLFFESMISPVQIGSIQRLMSHFQVWDAPVIFTQHGHLNEELYAEPSPSQLVQKWGAENSIGYGSGVWELLPFCKEYITQAARERRSSTWPRIVEKNTCDAFLNTDLPLLVEASQVKRLLVTGVMTDCCCDTTARSAFCRGYETWLISDACASANKKQHEAGLKGFEFAFGDVLTTRQALETLEEIR